MTFLAVPSDKEGRPLYRKTPHSSICETEEEAREWANSYIEGRKAQLATKNAQKRRTNHKKLNANFARLDRVVIYEDTSTVFVNPIEE